jgi:hypothetical protein
MSDFLKHECGIAAVRLRKPLAYYLDRYGTSLWGFNKLFLLMEKQHNRGQDGTGIGCVKLDMPLGQPYVFRRRGIEQDISIRRTRKASKSALISAVKSSLATCATALLANSTKVPAIHTCAAATGRPARSWSWAIST